MTHLSADWRFLDPIPRHGRALVLGADVPDLASVYVTTTTEPESAPQTGDFDLVVITGSPSLRALNRAADAVAPDSGVVVAGVGRPTAERVLGIPTRPRLGALARRAAHSGLEIDRTYGAVPNPWNPEYLFEMGTVGARFAIERFVRSRRPVSAWMPGPMSPVWRVAPLALTTGALVLLRRPTEIRPHA